MEGAMGRMVLKLAAAGALSALASVASAQAPDSKTLRIVPFADMQTLDPITTTAGNVQSHAMHVYDFLFGQDEAQAVRPQMVDTWSVSPDGLEWRFTLREGLRFHDGQPVTTEDVIASLKRWGARDPYGRQIMALTAAMNPEDAKTFRWTLTRPFSLMLEALSKSTSNVPAIMPKRLAATDPMQSVTDPTGSGPFVFARDEWVPGVKLVYRRNPDYRPRTDAPSGSAGAKLAKVDRIEWRIMSDPQTAVLAFLNGEVDYLENPPTDLIPRLRAAGARFTTTNALGFQGMIRPNHLHPPFNDARARRALLYLVDQELYLRGMFGEPRTDGAENWRVCRAYFNCGGPFATDAGAEPEFGKNKEKAKALLAEAGYKGETLVLLQPTDIPFLSAATQFLAQDLRSIGVAVELQAMDFGTLAQRRANRAPPGQGGWHLVVTWWNGAGSMDPVGNVPMQATCERAWPGWPCDAAHQALIDAFAATKTPEERQRAAAAVQESAYRFVPYVPFGQWFQPVAHAAKVKGLPIVPGAMAFWGVEKE
jgi:peptide/nickel transport system substrate-binding protein